MRTGCVVSIALLCCLGVGSVPAAAGGLRIVSRPDGTTFIYNESAGQRARRLADHFVDIPDKGEIASLIRTHAAQQSLDERLVRAVIQVESGYNPRALSSKGAIGLMQLMPGTARDLDVDPWDVAENIKGGTVYLRQMLDLFGGAEDLALAAYNAGPGAVQKYGGIPPYPDTEDYVERILRLCGESGLLVMRSQATASTTSAGMVSENVRPASLAASVPGTPRGPRVKLRRDSANRLLITNKP